MELYLGIDIGTTHIKVCAADTNGRVVKTALRDQESRPVPGWGNCISPEELWDKTVACLEEVLSETEPGAVKGIGITSMAEAGVPVGRDGKPLMPIIPWNAWDSTEITGEEFPESLRGWGLYRKTGLLWHPKYTINQFLFLRKNNPRLLEQMDCFLSVSDYLLYCFTGERLMEESLACRTMLYNIHERKWDDELTELAGAAGRLPRVAGQGEDRPVLTKDMARRFGLREDVRVCTGGHDHLCAALAEDLKEGEVLNSMGTSEVYIGFLTQLPDQELLYKKGIQLGRFQGKYYWICNMPSSGASVEWLRSFLSVEGRPVPYESLMQIERQVPSRVMYLPFVNGAGSHRTGHGSGHENRNYQGSLLNLSMASGPMDAAQAVYEGIACESRVILELLEEAGIGAEKIICAGGGTGNPLLMQAKADITGRSFLISHMLQATALGAAAIAGGSRMKRNMDADSEKETISPADALREAYDKKYETYREILQKQYPMEREAGSLCS